MTPNVAERARALLTPDLGKVLERFERRSAASQWDRVGPADNSPGPANTSHRAWRRIATRLTNARSAPDLA